MANESKLQPYDATGALRLLEHFGFTFNLDWDDALLIKYSSRLLASVDIADALRLHDKTIVSVLKARATLDRARFIGGPMNGQKHGHYVRGYIYTVHLKRGKWATYVVSEDMRAFFRGYATNQAKARRLGCIKQTMAD